MSVTVLTLCCRLQAKCGFRWKSAVLRFWAPLWGLRGNVRWSSWAHSKACSGLTINVNRPSFARCYGWGATSECRL